MTRLMAGAAQMPRRSFSQEPSQHSLPTMLYIRALVNDSASSAVLEYLTGT